MKKSVRKRRGYDEGGEVLNRSMLGPEGRARLQKTSSGMDIFPITEGRARAIAAMSDEAQRRNYAPRPAENSDLNKARGGKVKKVVKRR